MIVHREMPLYQGPALYRGEDGRVWITTDGYPGGDRRPLGRFALDGVLAILVGRKPWGILEPWDAEEGAYRLLALMVAVPAMTMGVTVGVLA